MFWSKFYLLGLLSGVLVSAFFQFLVVGQPWWPTFLLNSSIFEKTPMAQYEICEAIMTLDLVNVV